MLHAHRCGALLLALCSSSLIQVTNNDGTILDFSYQRVFQTFDFWTDAMIYEQSDFTLLPQKVKIYLKLESLGSITTNGVWRSWEGVWLLSASHCACHQVTFLTVGKKSIQIVLFGVGVR